MTTRNIINQSKSENWKFFEQVPIFFPSKNFLITKNNNWPWSYHDVTFETFERRLLFVAKFRRHVRIKSTHFLLASRTTSWLSKNRRDQRRIEDFVDLERSRSMHPESERATNDNRSFSEDARTKYDGESRRIGRIFRWETGPPTFWPNFFPPPNYLDFSVLWQRFEGETANWANVGNLVRREATVRYVCELIFVVKGWIFVTKKKKKNIYIYIYLDSINLELLQNYINRQSHMKSNKVYLDSWI